MRIAVLTLTCFASLCSGFVMPAQSQTSPSVPVVTVRVGEHPDFDRVVFDWPHTVSYKVQRDGDKAIIQFAAPGQAHFSSDAAYLSRAHHFSAAADQDNDLTVSFTVNPHMVLKGFTSEKSVVIDIQGGSAVTAAPSEKAAAAKAPVQAAAAPEPAPPKPAPAIAPTPAPPPAVTPPAVNNPPAQTTATLPMPATRVIAGARKLATVAQSDITDTPLLVAALDPHTPTRAAIFARGGYGYIIFDRKLTLSADALTAGQQAPHIQLEPLDLPIASGFRFAVPPETSLRANRDNTVWQIYMAKDEPDIPVSTSLVAQPDFALGARFILPLSDSPEPVHFLDPVVGDDLIVVPLGQSEAFSVARSMADFQIVPAAQGLVIKPLIDKVVVRSVSDGLEITSEGGLHLSNPNDTGAAQQSPQKVKAAAAGKSIYDFYAWRGKPDESFSQTRQRLQQTIVDVPESERNRARLELARFYFAHGYGEEASALLLYLTKQVPDLMEHADFLALLGASQILAYHPDEGLKNLSTPLLNDQPEIALWQGVAYGELRNWSAAEEKFAATESLLNGYPEPFFSRFSVLSIEAALAAGKDKEAAAWIDHFENMPHKDSAAPAISYLHGVMNAKVGRAQAAEQDWKEAQASNDRLYKVRAELALIDLAVSTHSLTPAQAADRLEALRFAWRGDDLEIDILHRLGEFYIDAKNVKAGLTVLGRAVQLYPNSPLTPQVQEEMSHIFHDVFLGDVGKNMSPLDSLALYQEYGNLMPGGKDGIAVTRNLAERLVAIDLLDQAANLLEDLVKTKLQGEEKARTATRLAGIRLLDHKPEAALAALDYDASETLPADLQHERLLLRAKALSDMNKNDEALALIQNDGQESAKILKADIAMRAQYWNDASKTLLELVGPSPAAGTGLSQNQVEWLINCAIAMSLAGDQNGLDKLAIDYSAAMAGTAENDTFRILTQPEKTAQLHDIASVQARISDVDMFHGFLDNYRKEESAAAAAKK